jgi:hypothetical protein
VFKTCYNHATLQGADTVNNPTVYRVINKSNNLVSHFRQASDVATHMWGRRLTNHIVIKSDENGDRIVALTATELRALEQDLSAG